MCRHVHAHTSSLGPSSMSTAMPSRMSRLGVRSSSRRISREYSSLSVCARSAHTAGPCKHAYASCHIALRSIMSRLQWRSGRQKYVSWPSCDLLGVHIRAPDTPPAHSLSTVDIHSCEEPVTSQTNISSRGTKGQTAGRAFDRLRMRFCKYVRSAIFPISPPSASTSCTS